MHISILFTKMELEKLSTQIAILAILKGRLYPRHIIWWFITRFYAVSSTYLKQ